MCTSICGVDCAVCGFRTQCSGCAETGGRPFGGECVVASCCQKHGKPRCEACAEPSCGLRARLIAEFNALGIPDMPTVTELLPLGGFYVNLEYTMPSGQPVRLLRNEKIYLGYQLCKTGSDRCYGLVADENFCSSASTVKTVRTPSSSYIKSGRKRLRLWGSVVF